MRIVTRTFKEDSAVSRNDDADIEESDIRHGLSTNRPHLPCVIHDGHGDRA